MVLKKKYQHVTLKLWYLQFCTVNRKSYYIGGSGALQRPCIGRATRETQVPSEACALIIQSGEEFSCLSCNINQMFRSSKTFLLAWILRLLVTRRKMNNSNRILLGVYPVYELVLVVRRVEGFLPDVTKSYHCFYLLCFVNLISFLKKKKQTVVKKPKI